MGKMKSPITNIIGNPLKGKSSSQLKSQHDKTLAISGLKPPKSPLK